MNIEFLNEDMGRILLAAILGAILGVEREWKGKSAGFRTLMLVSVGSALFTEISYHMSTLNEVSDTTRIASNIVTGIGFIGAGLIFKDKLSVHGLTTAATTWTAAATGMAAGAGNYGLAIGTTIIAWIILVILNHLENSFRKLRETRRYKITFNRADETGLQQYHHFFKNKTAHLEDFKTVKREGKIVLELIVRASEQEHNEATQMMLSDDNVIHMDY